MRVVDVCGFGDGFAIRDLRGANIRIDLKLTLHAINDDLEVKLAHPLNNRLTALQVT